MSFKQAKCCRALHLFVWLSLWLCHANYSAMLYSSIFLASQKQGTCMERSPLAYSDQLPMFAPLRQVTAHLLCFRFVNGTFTSVPRRSCPQNCLKSSDKYCTLHASKMKHQLQRTCTPQPHLHIPHPAHNCWTWVSTKAIVRTTYHTQPGQDCAVFLPWLRCPGELAVRSNAAAVWSISWVGSW